MFAIALQRPRRFHFRLTEVEWIAKGKPVEPGTVAVN